MNMMNQEPPQNPSGQPTGPQGLADLFGIDAALGMLRRRFLVMAMVGVAAAGALFTFLMLGTPVYQATALVMINPRQERVLRGEDIVGQLPRDSSAIDSEIELMRSSTLMTELADALTQIDRAAGGPAVETETAGELTSEISVRRRGLTYVIEISANSEDPSRAQLIANTYADVYIASQVNSRIDTAQRANSWLGRRLSELREDVQRKESAAETFRIGAGLMSAGGTALAESQITEIQSQMLRAEADLGAAEARYRQAQQVVTSGGSLESVGSVLNNEEIRQLRGRLADIARRQADLETRYLETHPAVQAVRSERADMEQQVREATQRVLAGLADDVNVARARLSTLRGSMSAATGELGTNSNASVRLRELEREAAASREVYESYLQRYQEIADQDQLNTSDARLLSYATEPHSPSSPKLRVALALAIALGLVLGIGAGVAVEILDRSVKNADELEAKTGVPAIASIPTISKRMLRQMAPADRHPAGYLVARPMSAFTEALRVLRTVIVYSKLDLTSKVVAITSALPDEGKTTISACLARVAAMSGQRVVVVDCDLRKQSINDVLDVESDVGILQVLAGEAPWRAAIIRDEATDAHILPVATSGFTPRDVFGSEAMKALLTELRANYDLVVLDCAPILAIAETRIVVQHADAVVLVARAGRSATGAVRSAIAQTEAAGGKVLGVALNCVLPHWQSYSDSLYFYDSKSYYSVG
ncbi:tyrosine-protein kinase EpsD [alpha proteobacterium U9-1i]|nr:tyrosine-protein kinase EpsD [alpha proteobacterium U9-1i]